MIRREVIIGECRLLLGDCLEILPTLDKVDAVVTDPPYGIGKRSGTISKQRNKNDYASYDDAPENIPCKIIPCVTIALSLSVCGIITPGGKAWHHYPAPTDIGMVYQPAATGMTHWGRTTCQPLLFYGKDPKSGLTIKPLHFVLTDRPEAFNHPCVKPLRLVKWMVDRVSYEGATILDPFMGSGTTGVACAKMGRKFIGIEIDENYFNIACKRIQAAYDQPDMFVPQPSAIQVQEVLL